MIARQQRWQNQASKYVRLINPSAELTEGQRQRLWTGIKASNPPLAELLTTDPVFAELKTRFDARVMFTAEDINAYTQAAIDLGQPHA